MDPIRFFSSTEHFFQLSNYFQVKITIDGVTYPSSEHYYQSQKFVYEGASTKSLEYANAITSAKTPNTPKELASQKVKGGYKWRIDLNETIRQYQDAKFNAKDWDRRKDNVMRKVVFQKFFQNSSLKELLLSTYPFKLVEASPYDSYWGEGKDKRGLNMLGKILEETRYLLSDGVFGVQPPTDTSFWVIPNVLLASAYPSHHQEKKRIKIMKLLHESGVNAFVDLMEEKEKEKLYVYSLSQEDVFYTNVPIQDGKVISDDGLRCIVKGIMILISIKRVVLVHCFGGKGRTGTVMCATLCELYGIDGKEALVRFEKLFENRKDRGKRGLNLLTPLQRKQILRMYP